jgi:hypothetical protein
VDRLRPAARRGQRGGRVHLLYLRLFLALALAAPWVAKAQDDPESAYLKLHRATLAHNLNEMMLYASEERRAELQTYAGNPVPLRLVSSMMPRVYTVRSLATSPDGTRARMRATGSFTFMGTTAPTFGVIDIVREASGWKVDKFEWTGDKPTGFDAAVAQSPVRRGATGGMEKAAPVPIAVEPKPAPLVEQERAVQTSAPVITSPSPGMVERSRNRAPCEIKPVMTDEDLLNCGASPR